ncbi:helix-turn-helix domain-containing protein [Clostridium diolis]|uniref:Helix-turn-helix domain-containing protein n=1 Tax=Clostridium diolis TaxID=223919 RepID=A0AAV3W5M4_9CLOT|nr:helix-turn-helix domain-containing protein [Clostridium diolis]QES71602.1 helix-turn-helix domain-containing protein [Clostridium diolis]GEA33603.1 hypothetical protein CDIOL_45260 [Clostridium diolis]
MNKEKADYPIVLQTKDVMEIMGCSSTTAAQYIKIASAKLKEQGKIPPVDVVKNLRIPRDQFYFIYGI